MRSRGGVTPTAGCGVDSSAADSAASAFFVQSRLTSVAGAAAASGALLSAFSTASASRTSLLPAARSGCCSRSLASRLGEAEPQPADGQPQPADGLNEKTGGPGAVVVRS